MLSDSQPSFNKTIYFSVVVKNFAGMPIKVDTAAICATVGVTRPYFSDYNNKRVLIAYDEETERVVVVKLLC